MKQIYLDNGSTSFPKAPELGRIVGEHIDNHGVNISRGGYSSAYDVEEKVIETKETLCEMMNGQGPRNVVFTPGATASLNMIVKGALRQGDHIITSSMEHNAVVRPITQLEKMGVEWSQAVCNDRGELNPVDVEKLIKKNTKLVMITHGSNVCGTILPIEKVGAICKKHKVRFAVDGAQTVGTENIDMKKCAIDALAFPGHKCLMGPQGVGGLILSDDFSREMTSLIAGGTGSLSDQMIMPDFLPDKFQAGTLNIPGIIGLNHSLAFIEKEGMKNIKDRKEELCKAFVEDVLNISQRDLRLVGKDNVDDRCAVISLDFKKIDNAEVSFILEREHGIMTRCGMHCAPIAHQTLKTMPQGTVRFSIGYFNTFEDISIALHAINQIVKSNQ